MHLGEEIFSCIFQLSTSLLILSKHRGEDIPRGGGGGTPIWNRRGCSLEISNLTPKGDHLGVG